MNKFKVVLLFLMSFVIFSSCNSKEPENNEISIIKSKSGYTGEIDEIGIADMDDYIKENFSGIVKVFKADDMVIGALSETIGYSGVISVLTVFDNDAKEVLCIDILNHQDSPDYADPIQEDWFVNRFSGTNILKYLKLVPLDKEDENDIIYVTGATISSQGVVNGVNSAIGVWNYMNEKVEMEEVSRIVQQDMWQVDDNSFLVTWPGGEKRITTEELKKDYPVHTVGAVLLKTTGTEIDMEAEGVFLADILDKEGIDLIKYPGIGIIGRDGYYTMIGNDKLHSPIMLAFKVDGKDLKSNERPVRLVLPEEMGPYWVKMISNIDVYDEIALKEIDSFYVFDALVRDIEPYYYEYYGSKDKSYEVGKILNKFDSVNPKGFFTMAGADGLEKNETISMVRERYFIKVEGDNAPMNIAPTFKLGMNVKFMTYFSTTKDAVIFPEQMKDICRTKEVGGVEYMMLEDVMANAALYWDDGDMYEAFDASGNTLEIQTYDLGIYWLSATKGSVMLMKDETVVIEDFLGFTRK